MIYKIIITFLLVLIGISGSAEPNLIFSSNTIPFYHKISEIREVIYGNKIGIDFINVDSVQILIDSMPSVVEIKKVRAQATSDIYDEYSSGMDIIEINTKGKKSRFSIFTLKKVDSIYIVLNPLKHEEIELTIDKKYLVGFSSHKPIKNNGWKSISLLVLSVACIYLVFRIM
jgi:hypothetical protein